ncbi:hypothetical protein TNIN_410851 [Trichonephila inaurata madagascariensis]|uniref:Uncharacterized protein n=1 Tax=Trichonephila inaurata madagascariensis TaxID=2747483 RepID=A0A8X6Y7T4_9ARAC|nr:hypothetical protein TNIN_410851 [Trichonephila inaurata madagascariensis]
MILVIFDFVAKTKLASCTFLIWLEIQIHSGEIIKSAEIPYSLIDQELFDIVTSHKIYGPCVELNITSVCMENGKCKQCSTKQYMDGNVTDIDGDQLYH